MTKAAPLTDDFQFQAKRPYLQDITRRIAAAKAGDKITLMSMTLDPVGPDIAGLIDALCAAAKQGADVLLLIDAHNFLRTLNGRWVTPGPLIYHRDIPAKIAASHPILLALERIEAAGGRCAVINKPVRRFTNPFGDRSHIKLTLINDLIYLGGCNLGEPDEIDVMTNWTDASTANWLHGLTNHIYQARTTQAVLQGIDISKLIGDTTMVLVDSGEPRQSIIYDEAMQLIDEAAESVYITCQYFPNHITARHLEAAQKRGVKVTIIYNNPNKDSWPFNLLHRIVVRVERWRNPRNFFERELPIGTDFLHAKIIATESAGMIGSHNYVRAGVNWGTAEIALLHRDAGFARALITNIESQINKK